MKHKSMIYGENSYLKWSAVQSPRKGEHVCGDLYLVRNFGSRTLIAVVDGLGHGNEAYEASRKAVETLEAHGDRSLIFLVRQCHEKIKRTRGVVMNIALLDHNEETLTWMGIGNIEGMLFRAGNDKQERADNIISRGGVVGYKLPLLRASINTISAGDTLVFTTDGVDMDFENDIDATWTPAGIVEYVASGFITGIDDALVLCLCYKGGDTYP